MTERAAPNPFSPFADAGPAVRHLFPVLRILDAAPRPGVLTPTGCNRLAVVPADVLEVTDPRRLPEGLCAVCVGTMRADQIPADDRPAHPCTGCGTTTRHENLCALCRQELHDDWWPTRPTPTQERA